MVVRFMSVASDLSRKCILIANSLILSLLDYFYPLFHNMPQALDMLIVL